MKARIPFFMFLLSSLCIGLSLSAEEQMFYKPSDFRDISSCVISWEPVFGETKVYDLTKGEYPYPASGRYMAKEGWNSYPDGSEIPVTNYTMEQEYPEKAYPEIWVTQPRYGSVDPGTWYFHSKISTPASDIIFSKCFVKMWHRNINTNDDIKKLCLEKNISSYITSNKTIWYGLATQNRKGFYDTSFVEYVYRLTLLNNKSYKVEEISGYSGLQILSAIRASEDFEKYNGGKYLLFDDNVNELIVLDGNGQSWRMPFFKRKFDTECWGCEHVEEIANFPGILFYDRNYGIPRNAIRPPSNDPETGLPTDNWRYWKPRLVPDKPQSRYVQINLKTGMVEATYEGIHYARLRTPEIVEIPNVARDGCLGSALMKKGKQVAFLPYDRAFPKDVKIYQEFPNNLQSAYIGSDGASCVDYSRLSLFHNSFIKRCSENSVIAGITCGIFSLIIVTGSYSSNGKMLRSVYCFSNPFSEVSFRLYCCATVPADFITPGDRKVLYAFNGESIFIDNSGELLRIDVPKEALK